jgi:hypothetical protein
MRIARFIIAIVIVVLSTVDGGSSSAAEGLDAGGSSNKLHNTFFPYSNCALLTIKEIKAKPKSDARDRSWISLTVKVEEVLRGDLVTGRTVVLDVDLNNLDLILNKPYQNELDKKVLLAFEKFRSVDKDAYWIYYPYALLRDRKVTSEQLSDLRSRIGGRFYPYRYCILVDVQSVRSDTLGDDEVTAKVDDVILGDLKANVTQHFLVEKAARTNLPFNRSKPSQFLWAFTELGSSSPFQIWHLRPPIPQQNFDDADIKALKQQMPVAINQHQQLSNWLTEYLQQRWPVARIISFCRPERRSAAYHQNYNGMDCDWVIMGKIHPESKRTVGDVTFLAGVKDGVVYQYSIGVSRGDEYWVLEVNHPGFLPMTDEDFVKLQTRASLLHSLQLCEGKFWHNQTSIRNLENALTYCYDQQLVRNQNQIIAYTCMLSDGRKLRADLENHLAIKSISIDGKPEFDWYYAYLDASR